MEFFNHFPSVVKDIFDAVKAHGGEAYIVGGYVRDEYLQIKGNKDVDVEVYKLEPQHLHIVLEKFGHVRQIGRSFSVFKIDELPEFDFALARKETKTGHTYQDFKMEYIIDTDFKAASLRRDLTINSILLDPYSGEFIDPYLGIEDLKHKVIRHIDEKTFKEDPLRILRVARMQAKLPDFKIDEETKKICQDMVEDLQYLSKERVYQEYTKILLSLQPSLGLTFLLEIGALLSPLDELIHTHQRLDFHPEGSVFHHTMLVVDLAALCKHQAKNQIGFMWSALLHDIGKLDVTTPEGKAPNHDLVGENKAYLFMQKLSCDKKLSTYVSLMVRCHMILMKASREKKMKAYPYLRVLKRLDKIVDIDDLALLCKCDKMGRARIDSSSIEKFDAYITKMKQDYGIIALSPLVTGKDLKALGYNPSVLFSKILDEAYEKQLLGKNKDAIIHYILKHYER